MFAAGSSQAAPNFILVLADDLGWSSLSTSLDQTRPEAKSDFYQTPRIDELVEMGMRFSNAYAAAPVCSPTRYSIQFGKTPARLRRTRSTKPNQVDHDQISIAQLLKTIDPSYRTAHFGKWHIDFDPGELGYDAHDGITNNKAGGFVDNATQWHGHTDGDPKRVHSLTRKAIAFIESAAEEGRPFFLQLSHYAVHSNIEYSASSFAQFREREGGALHSNAGYAAMLLDLDTSVGALLEAYQELGLARDTYIIFTSDNGGMPVIPMQLNLGRPYPRGLNSPLLRGKWDLTEGGIRVPFAIAGPGIAPGSQSDTPVVSYDLLPTLASLAGGEDVLPPDVDGGSLRATLSAPRRASRAALRRAGLPLPSLQPSGDERAALRDSFRGLQAPSFPGIATQPVVRPWGRRRRAGGSLRSATAASARARSPAHRVPERRQRRAPRRGDEVAQHRQERTSPHQVLPALWGDRAGRHG